MKKLISGVLVVFLIMISCYASASDFSSTPEEKLLEELNLIRNELAARGLDAANKRVLVDQDGVQIYISDEIKVDKQYSWDDKNSLIIPIVIINNTNHNINMLVENPSVNGWKVEFGYSSLTVPAGKKSKTTFTFNIADTDVESIKGFEDVEFSLRVYDDNDWEDLFTTEKITIVAK